MQAADFKAISHTLLFAATPPDLQIWKLVRNERVQSYNCCQNSLHV